MDSQKELTQKKTITVLAILLSVVSIVLLGFGFYVFSNSKTVLLQSVSKFTNNIKEVIGESNNNFLQNILKEDKIKVSSDISIYMNEEELGSIHLSYLENKKDEQSAFNVTLSQSSNELLEANAILANNNIYVKVKDIMDYYYTECPYVSMFEEISVEDYQKVIDLFYESVKEELKEKDITKSKETIKLGEKNKKVTKLSYKITTKMITNVLSNTMDKILKDKNLVTSLSKTFSVEEQELKDSFQTTKEELKEMEESYLYYNVYYYGFNNIVLYELTDSKDSIKMYSYDNQYEIVCTKEEQELFTLKMVKNKDKYDISGEVASYTYTGTLITSNNRFSLDVNTTIQGMVINLKLEEEIQEKDNYQIDTKLGIDMLGTNIEAKIKTIYELEKNVDVTGIENAKDFNEITDTDIQNILTNIENHPFLSSIYQFIQNYSDMLDNSMDLDESYDYDVDLEY